jgi:hypothetical protein
MKFRAFWVTSLSLALLLLCAVPRAGSAQQKAEEPLTNVSVVKLVRAGFREKTVITIIGRRPSRFDLSPEALIELKKSGVSERIIVAMLSRQDPGGFADSELDDDDGFFGGGHLGGESARAGGQGKPGEVDIFGSSGGSKGRVKSNGGSGGVDSDTQTTGSVTARIIRPPAEPGGAAGAPKLERTPTLTNDSVIQLVEAGFTDGTIIRRIEQSPAEFDLSPVKLAELRKRRVSESVIAAMREAMDGTTGEEGGPRR